MCNVWRLPERCHEEKHRILHVLYRLLAAVSADDVLLRSHCSQTSNEGYFIVTALKSIRYILLQFTDKAYWRLGPNVCADGHVTLWFNNRLTSRKHQWEKCQRLGVRPLIDAFNPDSCTYLFILGPYNNRHRSVLCRPYCFSFTCIVTVDCFVNGIYMVLFSIHCVLFFMHTTL